MPKLGTASQMPTTTANGASRHGSRASMRRPSSQGTASRNRVSGTTHGSSPEPNGYRKNFAGRFQSQPKYSTPSYAVIGASAFRLTTPYTIHSAARPAYGSSTGTKRRAHDLKRSTSSTVPTAHANR